MPAGKFATETTVSVEKSRLEIEQILKKYGADSFAYMHDSEKAMLAFQAHGRRLRFMVQIPSNVERRFTHDRRGIRLRASATEARHSQEIRQRWRALMLSIKAKLEAVEIGLATFDDEFMAHIVLPNGQTASEWMQPQIIAAYSTGKMPALLLTE